MRGKQGRAAGLRGAAQRTAGASSIRAVASARQTRRSNDATDAPDARAGAQRRLIFGRPYKSLRVVDQRHQQRHAVGNHDARGAPRLPPGGAHLRGRAPRSGHPYAERRRSRPLAAAHPLEVARLEQAVEHAGPAATSRRVRRTTIVSTPSASKPRKVCRYLGVKKDGDGGN
jgi:hypothetical protein